MRQFLARRLLSRFERHYGYDVSYLREMLRASPRAFFKFAKLSAAAAHCEVAPRQAYYAAKLVGAVAEDCGPCTQLVVNMALEAGVPARQIESVLCRDEATMSEETAIGFRFAEAMVYRLDTEEEARQVVAGRWGEKAIVDLTLGCAVGRVFPMVKAGLGLAKECRQVTVDGETIGVRHRAA